MDNYFKVLNALNVSDKTEKKNGLTYLSWAWAWAEVKKLHPDATYKIYENDLGWFYHTDNHTCWVKTGVTINDIEHIEYLPVMDYRNKSIPLDMVTSFDVNKAIQRSLTKALARHGLGLYIYAGEDLPENEEQEKGREKQREADAEARRIEKEKITKKQADALRLLLKTIEKTEKELCQSFKIKQLEELDKGTYFKIVKKYQKERGA